MHNLSNFVILTLLYIPLSSSHFSYSSLLRFLQWAPDCFFLLDKSLLWFKLSQLAGLIKSHKKLLDPSYQNLWPQAVILK